MIDLRLDGEMAKYKMVKQEQSGWWKWWWVLVKTRIFDNLQICLGEEDDDEEEDDDDDGDELQFINLLEPQVKIILRDLMRVLRMLVLGTGLVELSKQIQLIAGSV